jgi:hypothetical protein
MSYIFCKKIEYTVLFFQTKTTLGATVFHFACFSAKDDDQCLEMIKIFAEKPTELDEQLLFQKNYDDQTALCRAAERSFEKSVKHLLGLYNCSKEKNSCDIELEYAVRSNNAKILGLIYQKHKNFHYQVSRNEGH